MRTILILFLLLFSSCSLERKLTRAKLLAVEHPEAFASFCASAYPIKELIIKGKDSVSTDTLYLKADSIPCPPDSSGKVVKLICPPQKIITKAISRVDTVVRENPAKSQSLLNEINTLNNANAVLEAKNKDLKQINKNRLITICGLLLALVISSLFIKTKLF